MLNAPDGSVLARGRAVVLPWLQRTLRSFACIHFFNAHLNRAHQVNLPLDSGL